MALIKGNELMVFIGGKPIAFATAHTLNLTGETTDVSSKDHGEFGAQEINKITWEATSENFVCSYSSGVNGYDAMFDAMIAKTPVDLVFGKPTNYSANGLVRGGNSASEAPTEWQTPTSYLVGKAVITSLNMNANVGEVATFSSTFTGNGPISRAGGSYIL